MRPGCTLKPARRYRRRRVQFTIALSSTAELLIAHLWTQRDSTDDPALTRLDFLRELSIYRRRGCRPRPMRACHHPGRRCGVSFVHGLAIARRSRLLTLEGSSRGDALHPCRPPFIAMTGSSADSARPDNHSAMRLVQGGTGRPHPIGPQKAMSENPLPMWGLICGDYGGGAGWPASLLTR